MKSLYSKNNIFSKVDLKYLCKNDLIELSLKEFEKTKKKQLNAKNNNIDYEKNFITIKYKINNSSNNIKIFGRDFVNNNKNKCQIIYMNKVYKLMEYLEIKDNFKNNDILEIQLLGINNITDLIYMFSNCITLISLPDISKLDTSNCTQMDYMFNNCKLLTSLPGISKWNTSNIISMEGIFKNCKSLLNLPDITKWNTSNVINMSYMFCNCESLPVLPDISKWDISKVKDMSCMFINCKSLTLLPDISEWDLSNNIDISDMLYNCISLSFFPNLDILNKNDNNNNNIYENCINLLKY